jgi:hypothetical protein
VYVVFFSDREVAERYAASVGAQHFNTSAKLNKGHHKQNHFLNLLI